MQSGKMRVTVLGSGTSTGVPLIHCSCKVCRSKNPRNKRLRTSVWVQVEGKSLLIDVSPDFRQQAIQARIPRIDSILITHPHADHIGGLDEIRSYNFVQQERIKAYGHEWTLQELPSRYPYIFEGKKSNEGGGVAQIDLQEFSFSKSFRASGVKVIPIELNHGSKNVAGFRIGDFAYLTDCHAIPHPSIRKLQGLSLLILDCLRMSKHDTHLHFDLALEYAAKIGAKKTVLTHMGHDFDHDSTSRILPKNVVLAYDGMIINLTGKAN